AASGLTLLALVVALAPRLRPPAPEVVAGEVSAPALDAVDLSVERLAVDEDIAGMPGAGPDEGPAAAGLQERIRRELWGAPAPASSVPVRRSAHVREEAPAAPAGGDGLEGGRSVGRGGRPAPSTHARRPRRSRRGATRGGGGPEDAGAPCLRGPRAQALRARGSAVKAAVAADAVRDFQETFAAVQREIGKAVVGHEQAIEAILTAFFAGGHVLIEGVPGIGKTLIVRSLAEALNVSFS